MVVVVVQRSDLGPEAEVTHQVRCVGAQGSVQCGPVGIPLLRAAPIVVGVAVFRQRVDIGSDDGDFETVPVGPPCVLRPKSALERLVVRRIDRGQVYRLPDFHDASRQSIDRRLIVISELAQLHDPVKAVLDILRSEAGLAVVNILSHFREGVGGDRHPNGRDDGLGIVPAACPLLQYALRERGPLLAALIAVEVAPGVERDEHLAGGDALGEPFRPVAARMHVAVHEPRLGAVAQAAHDHDVAGTGQ